MKGNVIGFDADTNTGAISGHDGHRYEFATLDWHSRHQPQHGDLVDFAPEGHEAKQIYLVEPEYVAPSFGAFYFSPRGRISRSQYWLKFFLPVLIIGAILGGIAGGIEGAGGGGGWKVLPDIFELLVIWPGIAVLIKRIHDRDKSGALVWALYGPMIPEIVFAIIAIGVAVSGDRSAAVGLFAVAGVLGLITVLVGIWFFIEFGCMRGTIGANRFGPDPVSRR
ncbi:MAG: DUF805 domain-containing protein [Stellaceae bacterium]